jgi:hypothetical protein
MFQIQTLERDRPNGAKMSHFFLLAIVMIDSLKHLDFYPSYIWHSTIDLKKQLEKALNEPKCYQPCKQMGLLKYSLEWWSYFQV